jgi:hypothetical protein
VVFDIPATFLPQESITSCTFVDVDEEIPAYDPLLMATVFVMLVCRLTRGMRALGANDQHKSE